MGDPTATGTTDDPKTVKLKKATTGLGATIASVSAEKFLPLFHGKDKVTVHYTLSPQGKRMDKLTIRIADSGGAVVFEKVVKKKDPSKEAAALGQDDGSGCDFVWNGIEALPKKVYPGLHPRVAAVGSPFEMTILVELGSDTAASDPKKVTVVPLLDRAVVVSRASASDTFDDANKLVLFADKVEVLGIVRAQVKNVHDTAWFVLPGVTAKTARVGSTSVDLVEWDEKTWGKIELSWQQVQLNASPMAERDCGPILGHKDAAAQNKARATTFGEFSNVVANGPKEGQFLGLDTLEYSYSDKGKGASPPVDKDAGTVRYRFDADYKDDALKLGTDAVGSPGRNDSSQQSQVAVRDYTASGIANTVHRVSRRSSNANKYLSFIEAYRRVPWVYGSIDPQVENFIGFDCADLAFGSARKAGLTTNKVYTNANGLARTAGYTKRRPGVPILYFDKKGKSFSAADDKEFVVPFGTTPDKANLGDVIFWDWDGKVDEKGAGKWHHTTMIFECDTDHITPKTKLVMAHHDGVHVETIEQLLGPPGDNWKQSRWTVQFWP
jgi:hypothetical protein